MDYAPQVLMWFQVVCIINMKTQPLGSYVGMLERLGTLYLQNLDTPHCVVHVDCFAHASWLEVWCKKQVI